MAKGDRTEKAYDRHELDGLWERVTAGLCHEIGRDAVNQWVLPMRLASIERDLAIIEAGSTFRAEWVERNYGLPLLRILQELVPGLRRIDVAVGDLAAMTDDPLEPVPSRAPESRAAPGATAPQHPNQGPNSGHSQSHGYQAPGAPSHHGAPSHGPQGIEALFSAPLDSSCTFETFVVGKPNELAHAAARRVAETQDASFNPVFLYGGVGLGKTHLMNAIAMHLRTHQPHRKVLYLSAEQFMYRFVQALRFRDTITFKQQFRSVDVLMIDDVQFIAGKDSTQEEFFHTFNALVDHQKQIVISGDRSPDQIDGIEERIKSRLQWGLVVDIHPTDFELRLGILQQKAEAMRAATPKVELDPKVLDFLAHRISSNVRILEGALTRLFAFAELVGRRIDMEMTQECLSDLLRTAERKVSIEDIKRRVCHHFNLRMSDLTSARRARNVARPRQVAMYLAKMLTTKSLPEIGRGFGGRDHTTVLHAVRKIESLRESDPQLDEDIEVLRRMLEA